MLLFRLNLGLVPGAWVAPVQQRLRDDPRLQQSARRHDQLQGPEERRFELRNHLRRQGDPLRVSVTEPGRGQNMRVPALGNGPGAVR